MSKSRKSSFNRNRLVKVVKTPQLGCALKIREIRKREMCLVRLNKKLAMIVYSGSRKVLPPASSKQASSWLIMPRVKTSHQVDQKKRKFWLVKCIIILRIRKSCKTRIYSWMGIIMRPKEYQYLRPLSARVPIKEVQTSSTTPSSSQLRK